VTTVGVVFFKFSAGWKRLVISSGIPGEQVGLLEDQRGVKLHLRLTKLPPALPQLGLFLAHHYCSTVVAHLTQVRCQNWSAVPWAGERKRTRVFVSGPSAERDPVMLLTLWFWASVLSERFGTFPVIWCITVIHWVLQNIVGLLISSFSLDAMWYS